MTAAHYLGYTIKVLGNDDLGEAIQDAIAGYRRKTGQEPRVVYLSGGFSVPAVDYGIPVQVNHRLPRSHVCAGVEA